MSLTFCNDKAHTLGMENVTAEKHQYIKAGSGFARVCGKCSGTGIFWKQGHTASGWGAWKETCYPCEGSGHVGKVYDTYEAYAKAIDIAERARARREAKRETEWEAGREARELAEAEAQAERIRLEAEKASWIALDAQVGDAVDFSGIVYKAITIDGFYGQQKLILVETEAKQIVKMFTSASWAWDVQPGEVVSISGVVGGFDEYEGRVQTTVKRPKLVK